ncbi:ArsR family transcriptional regulator [Candidatus Parcubacteria bacterium]|nr:MAG: ArsR family transcriptional regulator [Candidatus Parcubacteria bacterium]
MEKSSKQLERYFKGVANHRRIDILLLVNKCGGITVNEIAENLSCNFKTISEHTRKLSLAGLVSKKYSRQLVLHTITPYGLKIIKFIETF